jgi:hypothetical protein
MSNAMAVKSCFEQLYYPHAKALLEAEQDMNSGKSAKDVLNDLRQLPGIRGGVVLFAGKKEDVQWPDSLVQFNILAEQLFNTERGARKKDYLAPMMHRTLGGKVAPERVLTGDKYESLDLLARYVYEPDATHASSIICVVLDPQWLIAQVPSMMDSLYRENAQLLYFAASPLNTFREQSLGIVAGKDTLWWVGRKDVKIEIDRNVWPFRNILIPSYVHTIKKD